MEVHVGFTGWEWSFWLSKCFFINEWRFALDSQDCKDVFCEASAFLLMNGSLGWIHGVEIKFLITFFFFFILWQMQVLQFMGSNWGFDLIFGMGI